MADNSIVQTIQDAEIDARSLSEFIYKPASFMVARRLAPPIHTLQYYIDRVNSVNNAFSKSLSDATTAADIAINAANTANQNAIGLINSVTSQATQSVQNAIRDVAIDANLVTDALTTIVPMHSGTTSRTQLEKNRESISVWDFFTAEEKAGYDADTLNKTYDSAPILQRFFDYISINDVGTAYCSGEFVIGSSLLVGGTSLGGCKTKVVIGNVKIRAIQGTVLDEIIAFEPGRNFKWVGHLWVEGGTENTSNFTRRTVKNGVRLGGPGTVGCSHAHFTSIQAHNGFIEFGVNVRNLCTGSKIDKIRFTRCGSGYYSPTYGRKYTQWAQFSNRIDVEGTSLQRTTVKVDLLPSVDITKNTAFAYLDDELYLIDSIDRVNSTVTVRPKIKSTILQGELRYAFGGGVLIEGSDTSAMQIGNINGLVSAFAVQLTALYPPIIASITSESNFASLLLGSSISSGFVGGILNELYTEGADYDVIQLTQYPGVNFKILTGVSIFPDKCLSFGGYRNPTDGMMNVPQLNVEVDIDGYYTKKSSYSKSYSNTLDVSSPDRSTVYIESNNPTVTLVAPKPSMQSLFGFYNRRVVARGTSLGSEGGAGLGIPTSVTFQAPVGYLINGSAEPITYEGFTSQAVFEVSSSSVYPTNFIVTPLNWVKPSVLPLTTTVDYDPPALEAATQQSTTLPLVGAKIGDLVAVSFSKNLNGTRLWGEVTATDVVTVYHRNDTTASVDVASGNLKVKVI